MNLWQLMLEAFESLNANKMRSGLTMLGIVIGVAAVIALMGLGTGTEAAITGEIESIGTNLLYVTSGGDARDPEPLTISDAQALQDPKIAPSVEHVAPTVQGQVAISIAGESASGTLYGITPEYFLVQNAEIAEGIQISGEHLDEYASVVILGSQVAEDLFGSATNLLGETVRINGQIFKVIGVLEEQGGSGFTSSDSQILTPLTTAQTRLLRSETPGQVDLIYVQAKSSEAVNSATDEVSQVLRSRHNSTLGEDDFEIMSTQSFLDMAETITATLTMFLGGIAAISLLVGGIGIMNIMLVTVVERTKEIGLRKAMGARKSDILIQFMVESSLLSLGGGIIGIALGYGLAFLIGNLASLTPSIEIQTILLATIFSAAVGVFFGLYPANRAASLEPVEALRTE